MTSAYENCMLCPRKCGINRKEKVGYCGEKDEIRISRAALHFWEEPCISGERGSGTIFFCGCALKCSFCQNYDISRSRGGGVISVERLTEIFYELKNKGAHNINLVTPSHFAPSIVKAIDDAHARGFDLPFVWNVGGYESAETVRSLSGCADIFLTDFKYMSAETAQRYSNAPDYPEEAKEALCEMVNIAGKPVFDSDGMMKRGVIVRVLVLPSHADEAIEICKYLYNSYGDGIYVSIMNQYTPLTSEKHPELRRRLTTYEYQKVLAAAEKSGIINGFVQDGGTQKESFIPPFDLSGVYSPET